MPVLTRPTPALALALGLYPIGFATAAHAQTVGFEDLWAGADDANPPGGEGPTEAGNGQEGQAGQAQPAAEAVDFGGPDAAGEVQAGGGEVARKRERRIQPFLAVDWAAVDDFKSAGDGGGYIGVAAGAVVAVHTGRTDLEANARLQHRIPFRNGHNGGTELQGLMRGRYALVREQAWLEAGALSMRSRYSRQGFVPDPNVGRPSNSRMVYSAFAGPRFKKWWRGVELSGRYHLGYARTDSSNTPSLVPTPGLDTFSHSVTQIADLGLGQKARGGLFGWTLTAHYEREQAGQLQQRYSGGLIQAELVKPISRTLALTGGAGWEKIRDSQREPLLDAQGRPVLHKNRLVRDPNAPRRLAYDTEGLIWDTGFLWRPSKRTSGELKLGRRYGSFSVVGSLAFQPRTDAALDLIVYDGIATYGRTLTNGLAEMPDRFTDASSPFGGSVTGCVFGQGAGGAGACLPIAGATTSNGVWRGRGTRLMMRQRKGPWAYAVALSYSHRRYYRPAGYQVVAEGLKQNEEIVYATATVDRQLTRDTRVAVSVYGVWQSQASDVSRRTVGGGGNVTVGRRLTRQVELAVGGDLYGSRDSSDRSQLVGALRVGLRYGF